MSTDRGNRTGRWFIPQRGANECGQQPTLRTAAGPCTNRRMAKADRLERLDVRRTELETEYMAALIDALRVTASGKWGLFDHNADRWSRKAVAPIIENLAEIGQAIDQMREQLGMPPFALQQEFLASRGPVKSDAVGEPKQAQAWLDRLDSR